MNLSNIIKSTIALCLALLTINTLADTQRAEIKYQAIGDVPKLVMTQVKEILNKHKISILNRYNVKTMPLVTVKVWQDRDSFENSYGDNAEFVQGYVVQNLWEARFFNGRPELGYGVLHEYIHLVHLAINPSFNNNPRWLWEAVAVHDSGRPPVPELATLKCFSNHAYPTLKSLNSHPFNIYKVGFYLTDYIVTQWDQNTLVKLIQSNGDIEKTLQLSVQEFELQWIEFLKNNYGLIPRDNTEDNC